MIIKYKKFKIILFYAIYYENTFIYKKLKNINTITIKFILIKTKFK